MLVLFVFKQKTAYEMRISDWISDVCPSDLGDVGGVERGDAAIDREQTARARRVGAHQLGTHDMERPQFHPGIPRLRRVNMSRHAMRTATPISTCSVIVERAGSSAMLLSISTPRFIGPGCMTIDRKSVVSGTSVSVRVDLGGRRIIKKKK